MGDGTETQKDSNAENRNGRSFLRFCVSVFLRFTCSPRVPFEAQGMRIRPVGSRACAG
jgi:hypothetical protein